MNPLYYVAAYVIAIILFALAGFAYRWNQKQADTDFS